MCLLIWTIFAGERCGPWTSCLNFILCTVIPSYMKSNSQCYASEHSKVIPVRIQLHGKSLHRVYNIWTSSIHMCDIKIYNIQMNWLFVSSSVNRFTVVLFWHSRDLQFTCKHGIWWSVQFKLCLLHVIEIHKKNLYIWRPT